MGAGGIHQSDNVLFHEVININLLHVVLQLEHLRRVRDGLDFFDGRPLFGPSKTIRGLLLAVLTSSAFAPLIGLAWQTGALIGGVAMAGDLFSSFVKRRLKRPSSSKATGLDQVPESLFPALACRGLLSLSVLDILVCVLVFFVGEIILARLAYRLHFRDRPY